jgi:hypothetical protein
MKTTIEVPDSLFRKAKSTAAQRGQTLKQFVTEAIQEKLAAKATKGSTMEPDWMLGFGQLRRLHRETLRVQSKIDEEFEVVEPEDRL